MFRGSSATATFVFRRTERAGYYCIISACKNLFTEVCRHDFRIRAITNCPYANNQSKWSGKCIITNLVRCLGNIGDSCFARDPFRSLFTQPVPKYPSCLYFRLNREDECSNSTTKHVIRPGNAATLRRWKLLAG